MGQVDSLRVTSLTLFIEYILLFTVLGEGLIRLKRITLPDLFGCLIVKIPGH